MLARIARGALAGAAAGAVGAWAMNRFQARARRDAGGDAHGAQSLQRGSPDHGVARALARRGSDEEGDNAAIRAATAMAEPLVGHPLDRRAKQLGGTIAHYAMGVVSGALYGAVAERAPVAAAGAGLPFGAAVWLVADEGVVPALGLSRTPTEYPASTHAYAAAAHLVYGLATDVVRRALRRAL